MPLAKRGPKAPHSIHNAGSAGRQQTASPPRRRSSRSQQSARSRTSTPPAITTSAASSGLVFLDGGNGLNQNHGGGLGPDLTDLLSSAIGWEPSAVESGYASASLPAPASATTVLSPPTAPEGTGRVDLNVNVHTDNSAVLIRTAQIQQRWRDLSQTLMSRYPNPGTSARDIATRCILLFFEYLYALTPLVHKATLHKALALVDGDSNNNGQLDPNLDTNLGNNNLEPSLQQDMNGMPSIHAMPTMEMHPEEAFALITAVCAEAAFFLPSSVFPEGSAVADIFLEASRNCLNSYLETDLDTPNANSIIIRYFHSNCLHATGRPKYSWHIFGEATRLIQAMGLHDVRLLAWLPPLEAEMRRRAFWIVYMGDKSAAILNGRPITIHRFSFDSNITLPYPTSMEDDDCPEAGTSPASSSPMSCIIGFNANLELWQVASQLLLEIRVQKEKEAKQVPSTPTSTPSSLVEQRNYFHNLYIGFITELDQLPSYLQPSSRTQSNAFMSQCVNLHVSFYCLRVVILQNLRQLACFAGDDNATAELEPTDLRTTEIVRDMLRLLNNAPFWALQVNGEPLVEKLRLLGGSLLAIIHSHEEDDKNDAPLARRARADFSILLNILSRLDSKASDALRTRVSMVV
ncbi:hypothetical protein Sste5346_009673 [Sporothrix stenoceras]|uniref:Xylanolytic transcriptional activator regulatory domain-containing protein n=1 Tax=Sporothrix stenoceras TaxID=5173 RepID=A0ABR3YKH1_9PEZI